MDLANFIVKAKRNTYANNSKKEELENGAKKLTYSEGDYNYQDIYFGFNPFVGQEIIFYKNEPIWSMNYYGEVISKKTIPKKVYQFLRKAMILVDKNTPFRGPKEFKEGNFTYKNEVKGTIRKFKGKEEIFYQKTLIYNLIYHGGLIKQQNGS